MFCSISGNACNEAVVSKTGHIFEKKLVETYIDQEGKCPITQQPLTKDELYSVKVLDPNTPITPRVASATSVPSLLKSLQTSFDATMLEVHTLKVDQAKLQQELSRSLYQYDAACRVVARLMIENQQLKEELTQLKTYGLVQSTEQKVHEDHLTPMEVDTKSIHTHRASEEKSSTSSTSSSTDLPKELIDSIQLIGENLSKTRRKRKTPDTATSEQLSTLKLTKKLDTSYSGTTLIRIIQPEPHVVSHYIVVGKTRGIAVYFYDTGKHYLNLPVKQSKVTHFEVLVHHATHPRFVVARKDAIVLTSFDDILNEVSLSMVLDVTVHPSGNCFGVLQPNMLSLYSKEATVLYTIDVIQPTHLQFHPDGLLMAISTTTSIHIYYVSTQMLAASFEANETTLFRFSENGYHLAVLRSNSSSSSTMDQDVEKNKEEEKEVEEDCVDIWDLRKNSITTTLRMAKVHHLVFDYTGLFMACLHETNCISIYGLIQKQWSLIHSFKCSHSISDAVWGPEAKSLWVASNELKYLQCFEIEEQTLDHDHESKEATN